MTAADIYYHDIGDYLSREEKLAKIKDFGSIENIPWQKITPNKHGDWVNKRNDKFKTFIPLAPDKKFTQNTQSLFIVNAIGIATNRDDWTYNFSKKLLLENMKSMVAVYNEQVTAYKYETQVKHNPYIKVEDFVDKDHKKIKWTRALKNNAANCVMHKFKKEFVTYSMYRPFQKLFLYDDHNFIESPGISDKLFPTADVENLVICISCVGVNSGLSVSLSNSIVDLHFNGDTQCFPLYWYEEKDKTKLGLFDNPDNDKEYVRHEAVSDFIFGQAKKIYGDSVTKEDIFYYVYGFLHSPDYRQTFAADLKKDLPHIPLPDEPKQFWAFSKTGRQLAELHLNYENQPKPDGVKVASTGSATADKKYEVQKMRFADKTKKDKIIYNSSITVENIPPEVYAYVVNGRSPVEWIMERYQVTVDKDSGIKNDPNDWAKEHDNPKYILDLLLSVMTVAIKTNEIVKGLPRVRI
ncbi:putative helicase [Candidatus Termititenax aidoneus]|uniref:Helicase n=1 Tax=Termititenax aidoneus TaxID=2218524 RepID=A0A388TDW8_TERA1|nr:putative helicase [Candidatus Termititenax aidoneus]